MNRVCLAAILILGAVVRIHCAKPTPVAGDKAVEGTATRVAAATEGVAEPAVATGEPTSAVVASEAATEPHPTSAPPATKAATRLPSSTPTLSSSPTASSTLTSLATRVTAKGIIDRGAMNVRAGPGTEFPIVSVVYEGQEVTIVGKTQDGSWVLMLTSDGQQGWGWREFIVIESLDRVEVSRLIPETPTSTPP